MKKQDLRSSVGDKYFTDSKYVTQIVHIINDINVLCIEVFSEDE